MHGLRGIVAVALLLSASIATSADLVPVHDGDRVTGSLAGSGAEVGLVLDALEGTVLSLKVKGTGGLAPQILLYGPDDVRIVPGAGMPYRESATRARVRKLVLAVTGRYTIVLRSGSESGGTYRLKVAADHPRRIKEAGEVPSPDAAALVRFPAFEGTTVTSRVKGREGLLPDVSRILAPGAVEVAVASVPDGRVVRHAAVAAPEHADHRLEVVSREETTGRFKAKIRLGHPEAEPRSIVVDGSPPSAFTSGKIAPEAPATPPPVDPNPSAGGGYSTYRVLDQGTVSGIRARETHICRTKPVFEAMWQRHRPGTPAPSVNFGAEMVVGIFLGDRPAGDEVLINFTQEVTVPWSSSFRYVWVEFIDTSPLLNPYPPTPGGPTQPFVIIAMKRYDGDVYVGTHRML
jgi:hypothetical protein